MSCQPTPTPCSDCTQTLIDISNYCTDECVEKVASKCVYYDGAPITTSVMSITTNESLTDVIKELTKNSADLAVDLTYNATTRQLCLTKNGSPVRCFTIAETGYYMVLTPANKLQLWRQVLPSGPDVKVDEEDLSFSFADPSVQTIADLLLWDRGLHAMVYVRANPKGGWFTWSSSGVTDSINVFDAAGGGYWVRSTTQTSFTTVGLGGAIPANTATQNTAVIQNMLDSGINNLMIPVGVDYNPEGITSFDNAIVLDQQNKRLQFGVNTQIRFFHESAILPRLNYFIKGAADEHGIVIQGDTTIDGILPQVKITDSGVRIKDHRFVQSSAYGYEDTVWTTPIAKDDLATTAHLTTGNIVMFADSDATDFIGFTDGRTGMIVTCYFTNSNTTLINSGTLKLGGTNITPSVGTAISFYMSGATIASIISSVPQIKSGTLALSGDGASTTFSIPHGLGGLPGYFTVTPTLADAAAPFYVNADATNLNVIYLTAPNSGTSNLRWKWGAKL